MINKRLLVTTVVLLILSLSVFAAITGTGERKGEIMPVKGRISVTPPPLAKVNGVVLPLGLRDTLVWVTGPNTNFGGWTDDYFAEYFVPETDGILHGIAFNMSDLPAVSGGGMAVWVYSSKYNWPEINTVKIRDSYANGCHLGYYQTSTGKEAYGEPTEWVKGTINTKAAGAIADKIYDPLGEQLVPALGAITVNLDPTPADKGVVTADLDASGDTYNFTKGETLMVLIRFNGFPDKADGTDYRMGFYSLQVTAEPQPGLKFYAVTANPNGRDANAATDDWGWHIRSYAWDWRLYVEWTGDRPPVIENVTSKPAYLQTTPITITATIKDDNPSGGTAGVASAVLSYSTDAGATWTPINMTVSGDVFSADIPGQDYGTTVYYYITATDVNGNSRESSLYNYVIFKRTHPTLFVYDDVSLAVNTAKTYYWYGADPDKLFPYDTWPAAYGPITDELLSKDYEIVVHVMGGGPSNKPGAGYYDVYKRWLAGATAEVPRRLIISGQDYGWISDFADTTFPEGTFERDYLGIQKLGPQDINYDGTVASYRTPYRVDPVQDNVLTGSYYAFQGDSVKLFYDPYNEVGYDCWIDNLTPATGAVVDFTDPNHSNAAVGIHKAGTNFKTVFWTVDWLALSFYNPADTSTKYHWGLTDVGNLLGKILQWFGAPPIEPIEHKVEFYGNISVNTSTKYDNINHFGAFNDCNDFFDLNIDIPEPPVPLNNYLQLYFPHPEWGLPFANFSTDMRAPVDLYYENKVWDFVVATDQVNQPHTISITLISGIDFKTPMYLKNLTNGDFVRLSAQPSSYSFTPTVAGNYPFQLIVGRLYPIQTISRRFNPGWNMFALPLSPLEKSIKALFWDDLAGDGYFYQYNGDSGYRRGDTLSVGTGYWLGLMNPATLQFTGDSLDGVVMVDLPYRNNLIGNPYKYTIGKSNLSFIRNNVSKTFTEAAAAGWISGALHYWQNSGSGSYIATDTLGIWQGAWLYTLVDGVTLQFNPSPSGKSLACTYNKLSADDWEARLKLSASWGGDQAGIIGVHTTATDGFDPEFDFPEPPLPPAGKYLTGYFEYADWSSLGPRYDRDIRAATTKNLHWNYTVKSPLNGAITISWELVNLPSNYTLILHDPVQNRDINFRGQNSYTFNYTGEITFDIRREAYTGVVSSQDNLPTKFALSQNYPNPFNPVTTIHYAIPKTTSVKLSIYDLDGRIVEQLIDEEKQPGWYSVKWNAAPYSSGVYFYRLQAGDFIETKKCLVIK